MIATIIEYIIFVHFLFSSLGHFFIIMIIIKIRSLIIIVEER